MAQPSWKAPGTPNKEGVINENEMLHPRPKGNNQQRAGMRMSRRYAFGFSAFLFFCFIVPAYSTPFYVRYVAGQEWLKKAEAKVKSIWERRNERDRYYYMTQRKNTWWELCGFKSYDISSDENTKDITKYRR